MLGEVLFIFTLFFLNTYTSSFLQFKLIFDLKRSFHDSLKLLGMDQRVLKNETEN